MASPPLGTPLRIAIDSLFEDTANPRTEFPPAAIDDLAQDIAERGILQPVVVDPADPSGRHRIRFGAKRWRAARQAGLAEVPVTIATRTYDDFAQVAENLKRDGLSPLDLARFFQRQVASGTSNAAIAKRLGIDQTTVAHHLALLNLPPVLEEALASGRCAAPRTLYELARLHDTHPQQVTELVESGEPVTRGAVSTLRQAMTMPAQPSSATSTTKPPRPAASATLLHRTHAACDRLERLLDQLTQAGPTDGQANALAELRKRLAAMAERLP